MPDDDPELPPCPLLAGIDPNWSEETPREWKPLRLPSTWSTRLAPRPSGAVKTGARYGDVITVRYHQDTLHPWECIADNGRTVRLSKPQLLARRDLSMDYEL